MVHSYLGEIRMLAGQIVPAGWAPCDSRLLLVAEHTELFALLGTTYGGDGITHFALPDLRGRVPMHRSSQFQLGDTGGEETVVLSLSQLPAHTHIANANNEQIKATSTSPEGHYWGYSSNITNYQIVEPNIFMSENAISPTGNDQPHNNMMPSLAIQFIIALEGSLPNV